MVTFVLSSSPEQIAVQNRGYAIISRPDIASVKDLKGKRLAINTFGSSADLW
jgi:ABC-type nitrate/sulfonate/bicarbonate transport system substrate-binding protein